MTTFSIVVPAYNTAQYLASCLESIQNQTYEKWEAIVVVDGSPDECLNIALNFSKKDSRFTVINKKSNEGLHMARKTGVAATSGDYILFLDSDDELTKHCLEGIKTEVEKTPCDVLHFSAIVTGTNIKESSRINFEKYVNAASPSLFGREVTKAAFDKKNGYQQDWRIIQRAYKGGLARAAFSLMTDARLQRAEDSYEYFVIADMADSHFTQSELIGYIYNYGRGITGESLISTDTFSAFCRQFDECISSIQSYADKRGDETLISCAIGAREKLIELLSNDWLSRIDDSEKHEALLFFSDIFGADEAAKQLYRFIRDKAYEAWDKKEPLAESELNRWIEWADRLKFSIHASDATKKMESAAKMHVNDVANREKLSKYPQQSIRVFVAAHKKTDIFDSNVLQPIQVGACSKAKFPWALHDDEGDNISNLNPSYCELTAQYWAWKNVDAEYYGFCHYRRYFNFSDVRYEENDFGEIMEPVINGKSQRKYGLTDENISALVSKYDIITTEFKDLRDFPGDASTPYGQYEAAPYLHIEDLDLVMSIVKEMYPEYVRDVDDFLNGNESCFCNMFIMKKALFNDYCSWLFPILERFVELCDMSLYSKEALRTPGHLSERLFNVFFKHYTRQNEDCKTKQLQCVHFENTDTVNSLPPVELELNYEASIPVVFAADNNYVPMVATTICSMLENASERYQYDIVVLEQNISQDNKNKLQEFTAQYPHANVRFLNVSSIVNEYELTTSNAHISVETYYRFLIQQVLPYYDKVLYLDSDLIIQGDISELFNTNLGDNLLAASHDIDFMGNLNMNDKKRIDYNKTILKMHDPYDYFQAGVLVLNTKAMRDFKPIESWLEIASNPEYIYNDQDVLNAQCEGRVTFLAYEWNVMHDCGGRIANVFSFAPANEYEAYLASRNDQRIIHYAGNEKPWNTPSCDQGTQYWKYAKKTPFYEKLLAILCQADAPREVQPCLPPKAISENNPLRTVIDPLMPLGTKRREAAKSIGRAIRGRN